MSCTRTYWGNKANKKKHNFYVFKLNSFEKIVNIKDGCYQLKYHGDLTNQMLQTTRQTELLRKRKSGL